MKVSKILLATMAVGICTWAQADTVSSSIPLTMEIAPKCTIDTPTKVLLVPRTGEKVYAKYTVTCNKGYNIKTMTSNYGADWTKLKDSVTGKTLNTYLGTLGPNNSTVMIQHAGGSNYAGSSVDTFTVDTRLAAAVTATQTAGTYTDNYNITVTY